MQVGKQFNFDCSLVLWGRKGSSTVVSCISHKKFELLHSM